MAGLISTQNYGRTGQIVNPMWSLKKTSSQTNFPTASQVDIEWQTTKFLQGGCQQPNATNIVVPLAGIYDVYLQLHVTHLTSDGNYIDLRFIIGSSTYLQSFRSEHHQQGVGDTIQSHIMLKLAAGDSIKGAVYIDGGTANTDISGGDSGSYFSGRYLGH